MRLAVMIFALSFMTFGCEKKEDDEQKGDPINAPKIKPPVERNAPSGLGLTNLFIQEGESENNTPEKRVLFEVQRYLKPSDNDAVGAMERLDAIDDRMTELDKRVQDSPPRLCLEESARNYTLQGELPNSETFTMKLNCQENLDGGTGIAKSSQLAFGLTDDDFYIFERTGNHNNAVLAKSNMDETRTEFWQVAVSAGGVNAGAVTYIHLAAEDDVGMEIATAGSAYSVFDCGMRMKSNSDYVYIEAYDFTSGDSASCATELTTMCLTASDMEATDSGNCSTAGLTSFTLTQLTRDGVSEDEGEKIIMTPITGMIDFTESTEVEDEEG